MGLVWTLGLLVMAGWVERSTQTISSDTVVKSGSFYGEPWSIRSGALFPELHGFTEPSETLLNPWRTGSLCGNQHQGERGLGGCSSRPWCIPLSTRIQAALQSPEREGRVLSHVPLASDALGLQSRTLRGVAISAAHRKRSTGATGESTYDPSDQELPDTAETTPGVSIDDTKGPEKRRDTQENEEEGNNFVGMSPAFNTWRRYRRSLHSFRDVQQPRAPGYETLSTIETHIVALPNEGGSSTNSSLCCLTVSVQSALFNTIPLTALLVKEAVRTAAQLSVETVPDALQPKVEAVFDKRLPVLHIGVEALEWKVCSAILLSIVNRLKSWSVAETIDAIESQREKEALTTEFFQGFGESIRELQRENDKLNSIMEDAFWYTSHDPWLPTSLVLNSLNSIKSGAIPSPVQMMLDGLNEVLGASDISLVAETNWDGEDAPKLKQSIYNTARGLASIWGSEGFDPVYSGVQLRTVEWARHREEGDVLVALKSGIGLTRDSVVGVMGVFQVFERKASTVMKELECSTRLALETALLVAQQVVFPELISHAAEVEDSPLLKLFNVDRSALVEKSLVQEARRLGIASAEARIVGLEGASPYVVFHFTSSESGHTVKAFVNFVKKAISVIGKALKTLVDLKGHHEFVTQWVIPELKQKSEVLLGHTTDTTPWNGVLKTFYKRHIRDRVYDFNQPWICYQTLKTLSASQILNVWERFLAETGDETRRVLFVVGNAEDRWDDDLAPTSDPETAGKKRQPISHVWSHDGAAHAQRCVILRSFGDIRKYKLNRPLLVPYGVVGSLRLRAAENKGPSTEFVSRVIRGVDFANADTALPARGSGEGAPR